MVVANLPGGIPIYGFSLFIAIGMTLGLAWSTRQAFAIRRRDFPAAKDILNAGSLVLLGMLLGARMFFVLLHWSFYQVRPWETFLVNLGGLFWPGAVVGGLAGLVVAARSERISIARLADGLLPLFIALITCAWLGCWLDGCFYGAETNDIIALPAVDEWGRYAWRVPLQLIAAAATLALYGILDRWSSRLAVLPGSLSCLAAMGLVLEYLAVSFLRADNQPGSFVLFWGLPLDIWAALVILGWSALALFYKIAKRKVEEA